MLAMMLPTTSLLFMLLQILIFWLQSVAAMEDEILLALSENLLQLSQTAAELSLLSYNEEIDPVQVWDYTYFALFEAEPN
eukprot:223682-Ditylum_brightwellii.AAC.1